jgi:thioredoxin reductase (NADPH)
VGYSEDDAIAEFGKENVEVYHKYFIPLEWSLSPSRSESQGFCKAIVYKATRKVLGLHYLGPNAGEVMQGFGTAMKLGCKFEDITETVGIHPTTAEDLEHYEGEWGRCQGVWMLRLSPLRYPLSRL